MKLRTHVLSVIVLFASVAFSTLPAAADEQSDNQPDPPARAARLQFMSGSVSVQPHGTDDWVAGVLNRPLTNSDNIWADKNSRAEVSIGTGLIRIDSESSLTLTNVSERMVQLQLHQGAMNLHVRRLYDNETYEVDSPNQAFTVLKPGDYRFDVDSEGDKTVITVWRGEGESSGNGPAVRIRGKQQARFSNGNSMTSDIHSAPAPDDFDEWARSRDERLDHSASARYVSPDVVGYEDLDEYGTWRNTSEYGAVWVPSGVVVGWAPYRFGRWIWVAPWGWTWVEDEPWGYAPFHYGRWVYSGGYWGWAPGPIYVRPYYAPALVAWFGGPGWGVSVGFGGGYGWCPLGWGEPYVPWYHVSRGYFSSVNITNTHITNVTNITNIYNNTYINNQAHPVSGYGGNGLRYANLRVPNGFTAVSRNTLINSQPVARSAMRISPSQLGRVTPVRALDVSPTRNTMLGINASRSAAMPPAGSFARPTISRISPPVANRPTVAITNARGVGGAGQMIPNAGRGTMNQAGIGIPQAGAPRMIPRPPQGLQNGAGMRSGSVGDARSYPGRNMGPAGASQMRPGSPQVRPQSVPRPPSVGAPYSPGRPQATAPANISSSMQTPTYGRAAGMNVPRPSSAVTPGGYSPALERQSYFGGNSPRGEGLRPAPSYQRSNRPSPYYTGSYGRQMPSYGGGSYGRSVPSYNRGSFGGPMPANRGGYSGLSAPSYSVSRPAFPGGAYGGGRSNGGFGGAGGAPVARGGAGGGANMGRH